jgi:hypothetical protein
MVYAIAALRDTRASARRFAGGGAHDRTGTPDNPAFSSYRF